MRALYDPTFSERGVLMCAGRKLRAKDPFDFQVRASCVLLLSSDAQTDA